MRVSIVTAGDASSEVRLVRASSMLERMLGLLGRAPLVEGEAMVIEPCNMVHTIGMRYPIDVVFSDRRGRVLKVCADTPPSRMRACLGARSVIEMKAREAARRGWVVGTELPFLQPGAMP